MTTRIRRSDEELAEEQRQNRLRMQREARARLVAAGIHGSLVTDRKLVDLVAALDAYHAQQRKIADTTEQLAVALRQRTTGRHRAVELFDMVHLDDDYAEHEDNVGTRTGRYIRVGTGDWEGYARVDFTRAGGRQHWVPLSALVPA
jgi:hypothetical protein